MSFFCFGGGVCGGIHPSFLSFFLSSFLPSSPFLPPSLPSPPLSFSFLSPIQDISLHLIIMSPNLLWVATFSQTCLFFFFCMTLTVLKSTSYRIHSTGIYVIFFHDKTVVIALRRKVTEVKFQTHPHMKSTCCQYD